MTKITTRLLFCSLILNLFPQVPVLANTNNIENTEPTSSSVTSSSSSSSSNTSTSTSAPEWSSSSSTSSQSSDSSSSQQSTTTQSSDSYATSSSPTSQPSSTNKEQITKKEASSLKDATTTTRSAPLKNIYRLYNTSNMEHLYTKDFNEARQLSNLSVSGDWVFEGTVWRAPSSSNVPIYRLYYPGSGEHLYTKDNNEVRVLTSQYGWKKEGVSFYSGGNKPVYRLYNAAAGVGAHFVTTSLNEKNVLVTRGWKYEGISWYAAPGSPSPAKPGNPSKPHAKAPTYFSQLDSRWANVRLNSSTVGPSGCVTTSLAMILKGSYGLNVDPGTVAIRADGFSNQWFGLSGKDLVKTSNSYGRAVEETANKGRAINALKAGYPLIFYVNVGVGHAVVAYGYNNGRVQVYDPYNRLFYPNPTTTFDNLWNNPSNDPVDWDAGRPVFIIK